MNLPIPQLPDWLLVVFLILMLVGGLSIGLAVMEIARWVCHHLVITNGHIGLTF